MFFSSTQAASHVSYFSLKKDRISIQPTHGWKTVFGFAEKSLP